MLQNEITKADLFRSARSIKDCKFQRAPNGIAETFSNGNTRISINVGKSECIDHAAGIGDGGKRRGAER